MFSNSLGHIRCHRVAQAATGADLVAVKRQTEAALATWRPPAVDVERDPGIRNA
jgi:hypothetical protein